MKKLFNNVFDGKTILITGHTGFMGSWLSIWLNELGAKVIGYALDPYTKRDNFVITNLSDKIIDIRGDIRNVDQLMAVFKKYEPTIVFHLAAQTLVRLSYKQPMETYSTNVMGTVNLLETVRQTESVRVVVNVTSDKCYENKEWIWGYREIDPMGGYDPYSSSKGCSELVTSAFRNSFFNPNEMSKHNVGLASVRAGNVIGGGDWRKDRLIPDCVRALENNKEVQIRSPKSIRPWQHVLEPLSGFLLLSSKMYANSEMYCGAWNFGSTHSSIWTVEEIIEKLIKYWGKGNWKDTSNKNNAHEAKLLSLDISKARNYLGWRPILNIYEAIKLLVEWYKEDKVNYEFDVEQINKYISIGEKKQQDWLF